MNKYYIFFGHNPKLSLLELNSLIRRSPLLSNDTFALFELNPDELSLLESHLGGSVKIAQEISPTNSKDFLEDIKKFLLEASSKNVVISNFSNLNLTKDTISDLKNSIKSAKPIRFLSFETESHSLVALRKQHVLEINLIQVNGSLCLAKTVWIHNSDAWIKRDRRKPYRNIKKGMLPPKVARIMVNFATQGEKLTVLDPFCGTGTIAQEAALLGNQIIVSDLSESAVRGTVKNLQWLQEEYQLDLTYSSYQSDATHIDQYVKAVDAIVTEPYLGPLIEEKQQQPYISGKRLSETKLKNVIKGLDKMYRGALKDWQKILSENGRVVIVFPEFHLFNREYRLPLVDTCEKLGYNMVAQAEYAKPNASVLRKLIILEKNGTY